MPIKENFTTTKLYVTLNANLVIGTVTTNAFNFDNGFGLDPGEAGPSSVSTGGDDGITFGFGFDGASGTITFGILQSTTQTGSYTTVPATNLLLQHPLSTDQATLLPGVNLIRAGLIGATGPFYKVTVTSTVAQGIGWGIVEVTPFETPIRLTLHT